MGMVRMPFYPTKNLGKVVPDSYAHHYNSTKQLLEYMENPANQNNTAVWLIQ